MGNFDARTKEPLLGIVGEKEQRDVARYLMVVDSIGKSGAPIDRAHIRFIDQTTACVPQKLTHAALAQIFEPGVERTPVVEGHPRRQLHQLIEACTLGLDGFRTDAYPIFELSIARIRCLMGSSIAGRGPEHKYFSAVQVLRRKNRIIGRLNPVAVAANPLLRGINLSRSESAYRALRHTRLFGNADHYVAAVEVMQIIGEGTEGLEDLGARIVLVPGCLEFQARGFYGLSRQQVLRLRWEECCS